jgi:hypothetical protein
LDADLNMQIYKAPLWLNSFGQMNDTRIKKC